MRVALKTATTTAPNAAERQFFPDNLVADLGAVSASDYRHALNVFKIEFLSPRDSGKRFRNVRFAPKADVGAAQIDVRFGS